MINLEWLRTFRTIYSCKNITEASKKLNMTQPGVSKHLLALESHIGKKLFDRTTRKLTPTEYGKFLYTQINHPLQQLQKVEYYSGKRAKKDRLAITIGCTVDFFNQKLANIIYSFDMYIVTVFGTEKELIEAVEKDKIQLAVGIQKHTIYDHQFIPIESQELLLICSSSIKIPADIENDEFQLTNWLEKQTWFVYNNEQSSIKKYWKTNFNKNPQIVPRYILPTYAGIVKALKNNAGWSVVPKQFCVNDLKDKLIKAPIKSIKLTEQLFYVFKLKNCDVEEINQFMDNAKHLDAKTESIKINMNIEKIN